jgi:hypothetical protein
MLARHLEAIWRLEEALQRKARLADETRLWHELGSDAVFTVFDTTELPAVPVLTQRLELRLSFEDQVLTVRTIRARARPSGPHEAFLPRPQDLFRERRSVGRATPDLHYIPA